MKVHYFFTINITNYNSVICKRRCKTQSYQVKQPTENPNMNLALEAYSIVLVKTVMTNKDKGGDKRSPCRRPSEAKKNLVGEPLTRTAKDV